MISASKEIMNKAIDSRPKYSVCVCNYNMGDTIEVALTSVLDQLDEDYEVLVVDDGSTDDSVAILEKLAKKYVLLRYISLQRDRRRKLGETRNVSIREARGDYVLLHIDADDIWEPFIKDFVAVFHRIEQCLGRDILLSGQQVHIGKKSFLCTHGPYRNLYRVEDRDLWQRLSAMDAYIPLDHRVFRERLPRTPNTKFLRIIKDSWTHILYDLRRPTNELSYIRNSLVGIFRNNHQFFRFSHRLMRAVMVIPAYIVSKFQGPLLYPENMKAHSSFVAYRERVRGTFAEIMLRNGGDPDLSFLRPEAQKVFSARK